MSQLPPPENIDNKPEVQVAQNIVNPINTVTQVAPIVTNTPMATDAVSEVTEIEDDDFGDDGSSSNKAQVQDCDRVEVEDIAKLDVEALKQQVNESREHKNQELKKNELDSLESLNQEALSMVQTIEQAAPENYTGGVIEFLLKQNIVSQDQIDIANKHHKQSDEQREISSILLEFEFITQSQLSEATFKVTGVESIDLTQHMPDPELIAKVPKTIASQYKIIPIGLTDGYIQLATTDTSNIMAIDQVKRYFDKDAKFKVCMASDAQISDAIDQYYEYSMSIHDILQEMDGAQASNDSTEQQEEAAGEGGYVNPTIRLVDALLIDAVKQGVSDIHLEPDAEFVRIRYRLDGRLKEAFSFHKDYWSAVLVRIKIVSQMNIAETRIAQDGRISMSIGGRSIDFRVATQPTVSGENIVARILDKSKSILDFEHLGFTQDDIVLINKVLMRPEGLIVVTGPTGSGKTTTLYSILNYINSPEINIMTLEDPVEYRLPMIRQTNLQSLNIGFADGVKALMRQDPDVIFIGEVRDADTATMAIRASMTGHKVFTTLHTNDAIGVIPRLVDSGVKHELLSGNIICAIAQRLARRLCEHCKEAHQATQEECKMMGLNLQNIPQIYKHKGCEKCHNSGYKGRVPIYEILAIDKTIDALIYKQASKDEILAHAKSAGFNSMSDNAIKKVLKGLTDLSEVFNTIDMSDRL